MNTPKQRLEKKSREGERGRGAEGRLKNSSTSTDYHQLPELTMGKVSGKG